MSLLTDIRALPPEILAQRNTQLIADSLPPIISYRRTEVGKGTILAVIGLPAGNILLDEIDNNTIYRHLKHLLPIASLDLGLPSVRDALDMFALGLTGFDIEHAEALKSLAEVYTPVPEIVVRRICWSNDGQWLV